MRGDGIRKTRTRIHGLIIYWKQIENMTKGINKRQRVREKQKLTFALQFRFVFFHISSTYWFVTTWSNRNFSSALVICCCSLLVPILQEYWKKQKNETKTNRNRPQNNTDWAKGMGCDGSEYLKSLLVVMFDVGEALLCCPVNTPIYYIIFTYSLDTQANHVDVIEID